MSKAVLELQNLHKSFGALQATRDLSFCVNAGEIHALIGPNGAGKTTLIQKIYGALKSDTGTVLLNGRVIAGLSVADRVQAGIGRSFQISNVLMDLPFLKMRSLPNRRVFSKVSVFCIRPLMIRICKRVRIKF